MFIKDKMCSIYMWEWDNDPDFIKEERARNDATTIVYAEPRMYAGLYGCPSVSVYAGWGAPDLSKLYPEE